MCDTNNHINTGSGREDRCSRQPNRKKETMYTKCKNCGGDEGLHHYQTNQCPVGGREAPLNRKQEYMTLTFEPDNSDELDNLRETVNKLLARIEKLERE
jgi:hypothetical protein